MFTGLIEELGIVAEIAAHGEGYRMGIQASNILQDVKIGDSLAVNGCCLTVVALHENVWYGDVVPETLSRTNLSALQKNDLVNLERSVRFNGFMGGHLVQGHVDGVAHIDKRVLLSDGSWRFSFTLPPHLLKYCIIKGSIAIDGISLTIAHVSSEHIEISIIPHTFKNTVLCQKKEGDLVNIEVDLISKYVERFVSLNTISTP